MQVAATKPSLTFFQPEDVRRQGVDVWTDDDEWDVRVHVVRSKRTTLELTHTMPILLPPQPPTPFLLLTAHSQTTTLVTRYCTSSSGAGQTSS